jgi:hypothetical protein
MRTLHKTNNSATINNTMRATLANIESQLKSILPSGWSVILENAESIQEDPRLRFDAVIQITSPEGIRSKLLTKYKEAPKPVQVSLMAAELLLPNEAVAKELNFLVIASFLSKQTQDALRTYGFNYIDATGNIYLQLNSPAVYINTKGADKNPNKTRRDSPGIKGATAATIIRTLIDYIPPAGIRKLASFASADPGYVSRLITTLEQELLVKRSKSGFVQEVDWNKLLRRWATVYSFTKSNRVQPYLDPRGILATGAPEGIELLKQYGGNYAITGSSVASAIAPIAPIRLLSVFADDPEQLAKHLDLEPVQQGANVLIARPLGGFVYHNSQHLDIIGGPNCVSFSQAAADLLTGPGRSPSEGEELIAWMKDNEAYWRREF